MLALLSSNTRSRVEEMRQGFLKAEPFRHVAVDDFLETGFCARLADEFPPFEARRARNEIGEIGRKASVPDIASIGPAYREFDKLMRSPELLAFVSRISSIPDLLYDPDYVGGGTHENLDGQELDMHVDFNYHPNRPWHRRLNLIVFLNPRWEREWGGCLTLHKDPWDLHETAHSTVVPAMNRAVLFETTETSWHGFDAIHLPPQHASVSRRSIAVYFYTMARERTETAPSHGTVYVPRPLPDRFNEGYRLEAGDREELRALLTRRDGQIRFLYERELEISRTITGITRSPSFRIGRALTWPLRKLRPNGRTIA